MKNGGFRLARLFGIEVRVDWSLSIIFALIVFDLGAGILPEWHPGWSIPLRWGVAVAAAVLFFASILAHELSHALVAKAKGLSVPRITLFLFGGMAELDREPTSPGSEALIAIVGPLTSLAIGFASMLIVGAVADGNQLLAVEDGVVEPIVWLQTLAPIPTLLMWLGPVNIALALFNMVPGFPLDGGRVLRALLWWSTDDLATATRWSAYVGRTVGWALMIAGVMSIFRNDLGQGLWLVLIGWFLSGAAQQTIRQQLVSKALEGVPVAQLMSTRFERVDPDMTIEELAKRALVGDIDQKAFPVEREGVLLGLVCIKDFRRFPQGEWGEHKVAEIMTPASELMMLQADVPAERAAEELARREIDNIPVVVESTDARPQLLGIVRRADILRWVYLTDQTV
jgi:Zn-dependent protease